MRYYEAQAAAKKDLKKLKEMARYSRDRRYKRTAEQQSARAITRKRYQFDLALHRKGLVSPFDYEYPRLKNMSKLAQELYDRHLAPMREERNKLLQRLEDEECARYGE